MKHAVFIAALLAFGVALRAQYPPPVPNPYTAVAQSRVGVADLQHGVARLSVAQGDVNVRTGDTGAPVTATPNLPLVTRDHLLTSSGSRAEVEFDSSHLVRLAPNSGIVITGLEYHRYRIQLGTGTILCRVSRDSDARIAIELPGFVVEPQSRGEYRISAVGDGTFQVTVRVGRAEVSGSRVKRQLAPGQTLFLRGDPAALDWYSGREIARDQFDAWNSYRDRQLAGAESYRYLSRDIGGVEDLDQYGRWVPSQYGQVWTPRGMSRDWSPYSTGHWAPLGYYGWTWVDDAPWGWAPYHYGRWFWNEGYGWCWWPGAGASTSAVWSPASELASGSARHSARQPAPPSQSAEGWKRFGDPGQWNVPRQSFTEDPEHSGWHSFGQPAHPRDGERRPENSK